MTAVARRPDALATRHDRLTVLRGDVLEPATLAQPLAVFTVISLIVASLVVGYPLGGWRWVPLLGALWSIFMVVGNTDNIVYSLTHPAEFRSFVLVVFLLAMALIGVGAGIAATVQNYRQPRAPARPLCRRSHRWSSI